MPAPRIELLAEHPHLVADVADWHWREWGPGDYGRTRDGWVDVVRERARDAGIPFVLVAFLDGAPVGTISVCEDDGDDRFPERGPWISGMVVLGPARNQGVGRALLGAAEERTSAEGRTELWLHTSEAWRFYERCGWEVAAPKVGLGRDAVLRRRLGA